MSWFAAAATALGSALNFKAQQDANSIQQEAFGINSAQQREFAQKGIRWRVADAQAAGVHPLYALGANLPTYSPSPIAVGANTALGDGIMSMGQDIGRAVDAQRTSDEKFQARINELAIERGELENAVLRSQLGRLDMLSNPAMQPSYKPSHSGHLLDGQGNSALYSAMPGAGGSASGPGYEVVPNLVPATTEPGGNQAAGAVPEITWMRTPTGMQAVPNRDALEDADVGNPSALMWYFRNNVLPTIGVSGSMPPLDMLPEGYDTWVFDPFYQEWQPGHRDSWDTVPMISDWFD